MTEEERQTAATLLETACQETSNAEVAKKLGYSRGAISCVRRGCYAGDADKVLAKALEIFGRVSCPYLRREITQSECRAVLGTDTGAPFTEFSVQEGEAAFELLDRAARQRGVLLTADGLGNLVIARAGTARVDVALAKGENILNARGKFSHKDRFSTYIVKGQRRVTDDDISKPEVATQVMASIPDTGVTRYRPLIVLAEDMGDGATYQQRVNWECNTRLGKSIRTRITVQGWRTTEGGALWQTNRLVSIRDDWQGLDTELLIAKVSFSIGEDGTKTVLELTNPAAFDVEPLKAKQTKKKKKGGGEWL